MITLAAVALVAAVGAPHKVVRKTAALDFSYQWPAEAVAIPALDQRFYKDARKNLAEAQKNAAEDQALARSQKRDFNPEYYSMEWTTAGETARLLSLQSENGAFTGGAHPNTSYGALLWDRRSGREIKIGSMFLREKDFATITHRSYCTRLDAERAKKRQGEKLDLPEFNTCPKYSELAIAPVDRNKDGRFDAIDFVASPYVAGPYVEGEYDVRVPVTAPLIAALKPEYRSSFRAQRQ
ncbi:MAG TPA: DUF4163 domain-containing protein [Sphingomicrobium sp.]